MRVIPLIPAFSRKGRRGFANTLLHIGAFDSATRLGKGSDISRRMGTPGLLPFLQTCVGGGLPSSALGVMLVQSETANAKLESALQVPAETVKGLQLDLPVKSS